VFWSVANPNPEVRYSGRARNAALYISARPECRIRIRHQHWCFYRRRKHKFLKQLGCWLSSFEEQRISVRILAYYLCIVRDFRFSQQC
jgi:hypothetical protein